MMSFFILRSFYHRIVILARVLTDFREKRKGDGKGALQGRGYLV